MPDPCVSQPDRHTYVVVWDVDTTGEDDFGQPRVSDTPDEILVRWEQTDREVYDPAGNKIAVDVQLTVNRDVLPGSAVWRGRIDDLTGTDPVPPGDVRRVVSFDKIPDAKGRAFARSCTLARLKNSLPTRV